MPRAPQRGGRGNQEADGPGGGQQSGWRVLADASARLSLPYLPGGLATRLAAAEKDLVRRARLLAEAADNQAIHDLSKRISRLTGPATGETVLRRQPRSRPTRSRCKGKR